MFKRILVAVDGSPASNAGLKSAIALAADQKATLFVLHVINDPAMTIAFEGEYIPADYAENLRKSWQENGRKVLAKAEALTSAFNVDFKTLLIDAGIGSVAGAILQQAHKLKPDVIVLGTHGRRGLRRVLMGSDAENVVREARVPVLLVRKEAVSGAGATAGRSSAKRRTARSSATETAGATP